MRGTSRTSRRLTVGELVVSAFEEAARFGGDARTVAKRASRDVEARLRRAGRLDLIRALSSGVDGSTKPVLRTSAHGQPSEDAAAPFAAAG